VLQWRHYEPDEGDEEMTSDVEEEIFTAVEDYDDFGITNKMAQMVFTGHLKASTHLTTMCASQTFYPLH
jgi:hypothetical protein